MSANGNQNPPFPSAAFPTMHNLVKKRTTRNSNKTESTEVAPEIVDPSDFPGELLNSKSAMQSKKKRIKSKSRESWVANNNNIKEASNANMEKTLQKVRLDLENRCGNKVQAQMNKKVKPGAEPYIEGKRMSEGNRSIGGIVEKPKEKRHTLVPCSIKKLDDDTCCPNFNKPIQKIPVKVGNINKSLHTSSLEYKKLMNEEGPVIDSHCHLDFIYDILAATNLNLTQNPNLSHWMKIFQVFSKNFKGCIVNFINPGLYCRLSTESKQFDFNWMINQIMESQVLGATYGVHPKYSDLYNEEIDKMLREFCKNNSYKAKAIGECGIDTFRNKIPKEVQAAALENQLRIAHDFGLPVVIHCRGGNFEESNNYETERFCLSVMQNCLSRFHTIHRHCFTMDIEVYSMWISAFPNTYFGFTPGLFRTPKQKEAMEKIPLRRMLLETDSPYFRPQLFNEISSQVRTGPPKCSFPGMAISTAATISEIKKIPLTEVLKATYENTKQCYELAG